MYGLTSFNPEKNNKEILNLQDEISDLILENEIEKTEKSVGKSWEIICQNKALKKLIDLYGINNWKKLPYNCPRIAYFLTKPSLFLESNFNDLTKSIIREKRQIIFKTLSQAKVCNEYTLTKLKHTKNILFLFNLEQRSLNWLEIKLNNELLPIVSKKDIFDELKNLWGNEWTTFYSRVNIKPEECLNLLYEASGIFPCFVYTKNITQNQTNFLTIEYFDSIKEIPKTNKKLKIGSYIQKFIQLEFQFNYTYNALNADSTTWLYINAPKHFFIKSSPQNIYKNASSDREVLSYSSKFLKNTNFVFFVKTPDTLLFWYQAIVTISFVLLATCGSVVFFHLHYHVKFNDIFLTNLLSCNIAFIAALVATRGWLIHEENMIEHVPKIMTYELWALAYFSTLFLFIFP